MEEKVYEVFKKLGIKYDVISHPAAFTCEDINDDEIKFDGVVCKNLFLRNKNKSNYYLICTPLNKKIDIKQIEKSLEESKLSFGSEDRLKEKLNIERGSVSLLNIIGIEETDVIFIIDKCIMENNKVGFHPNVNTATIIFSTQDIEKILRFYNVKYKFIEI